MLFKKGDRVRILRKAKSGDQGWRNAWISEHMDAAVGKIGKVIYVYTDRNDVTLEVPGVAEAWSYPAFVLRKVRTATKVTPKKRK